MKKYYVGVIAGVVLVAALSVHFLSPSGPSHAGSTTLALSPGSQTVSVGSTITLTLTMNAGVDTINAAQANISYPANLFDSVTVTPSSGWGIVPQQSASSGIIKIAVGSIVPKSGVVDVATITLHASAAGTGSLAFLAGTEIISSTTNQNVIGASTGGTYTIKRSKGRQK